MLDASAASTSARRPEPRLQPYEVVCCRERPAAGYPALLPRRRSSSSAAPAGHSRRDETERGVAVVNLRLLLCAGAD
jgi:hypothetical protein